MKVDQESYTIQVVIGIGTGIVIPSILRVRVGDLVRWQVDQGSLKVVLSAEDEGAVVFDEGASDGPGSGEGGAVVQGTAAIEGLYNPVAIVWQVGQPPVSIAGVLIIDP